MSLRTDIQKKIHQQIAAGTFNKITYDSSHLPVDTGVSQAPSSIVVNELRGGLSDSARYGATNQGMVIRDWRFEAVAEWPCEVDVSYFLQEQLIKLYFNVDNALIGIVPSGDFQVTHPPRQASHNGTKLTIGLTVNTRR